MKLENEYVPVSCGRSAATVSGAAAMVGVEVQEV